MHLRTRLAWHLCTRTIPIKRLCLSAPTSICCPTRPFGHYGSIPKHSRFFCVGVRTGFGGKIGPSIQSRCRATAAVLDIETEAVQNSPSYCSGCGVKLQQDDPDLPGFFIIPKPKELTPQDDETLTEEEKSILASHSEPDILRTKDDLIKNPQETSPSGRPTREGKRSVEHRGPKAEGQVSKAEEFWEVLSGTDVAKEPLFEAEGDGVEEDEPVILCARCYSLQHYGKVKSQAAESVLPAFDLGKKVGQKIALQKFRTPIVLCVVDLADFDGSLPRHALLSLLPRSLWEMGKVWNRSVSLEETQAGISQQGGMAACKFVVACNKVDLLPKQATHLRVQGWAKRRIVAAGLPAPISVHMISSLKQVGIKELLKDLGRLAGAVGDVWVVGAQNAGKSSLINSMQRVVGKKSKKKDLTTAPLPGTTLGMLRVDGIMTGRNRMFDTPGVPQSYQLSSCLTQEEVKLLLPRGRLSPRTFRASVGQTILIGGVARIDLARCSRATMYLTVWASNNIKCHYGKTEGAEERYEKMAGTTLMPPLGGSARLLKLGPLLPATIHVEGEDWKTSSQDLAIAVAIDGSAELRVWTPRGVAVTKRNALLPDLAAELQRPGLSDKFMKIPRPSKKQR